MSSKKKQTTAVPKVFQSARTLELARQALFEVAPEDQIGELLGHKVVDDQVVNVLFDSLHPGYPHWNWCATLTSIDGKTVTVTEVFLAPGEEALLAPDWVPWEDRLQEFREEQEAERLAEKKEAEAQAAAKAAADAAEHDEDSDDDDDDSDEDILESHFDHELRGELPMQLDQIVDDLELDDPNPL